MGVFRSKSARCRRGIGEAHFQIGHRLHVRPLMRRVVGHDHDIARRHRLRDTTLDHAGRPGAGNGAAGGHGAAARQYILHLIPALMCERRARLAAFDFIHGETVGDQDRRNRFRIVGPGGLGQGRGQVTSLDKDADAAGRRRGWRRRAHR